MRASGGIRKAILAVVTAGTTALTACSSTNEIVAADGSDLAQASVLRIAPGFVLDAIDGDSSLHGRSTEDRPLTVYVAPGQHTLTLRYRSESATDPAYVTMITTTESAPLDFEVSTEPGIEYDVGFVLRGDTWTPNIRERHE